MTIQMILTVWDFARTGKSEKVRVPTAIEPGS